MEQNEFNHLYTEIEHKLRQRFWFISRDHAMFLLGAATVLLALTVTTTWFVAKAATSNREIEELRRDVQAAKEEFRGPMKGESLARIVQAITVHESGVISVRFPNNKGRFQIEAGGRLMWYESADHGGHPHEIHAGF